MKAEEREDLSLYPIGIAAELLGTTVQTLRLYEKHGFLNPYRRNRHRYYSDSDMKWLGCLRDLIHNKKISIEGIKKLLHYAPCWAIAECSKMREGKNCSASMNLSKQLGVIMNTRCNSVTGVAGEDYILKYVEKSSAALRIPGNTN